MSQFKRIPRIPTSKELEDLVFSQLKKIRVEAPRGAKKRRSDYSFHKTLYFRQFRIIFPDLEERLQKIVDYFPIMDELHPFHKELIDVLFGIEKLRIALGRISNTKYAISSIQREVNKKLGNAKTAAEAKRVRGETLGRLGSTIKKLREPIDILIEAKIQLSKVPDFDVTKRTIAFAGAPNVGKSSFVELTSTGTPEIASYPFTTKELNFGHRRQDFELIQLMDTPGLLDRPIHERNEIEMRSILALKYLTDCIIFLFDPSKDSPQTLEQQISLQKEIVETFPEIPMKSYINKGDILEKERIDDVKALVGDLPIISTMPEYLSTLEEIVLETIQEIPTKDWRFKLPKKLIEPEEKIKSKKSDKIEWIFFDEEDDND
ncbi:MAG: NOG1 family protein [Candidatus Heimdallarchaeota archaeon]